MSTTRKLGGLSRRAWLVLLGFVIILALAFKPTIQNDGVGYFAYLHSVVVDHDLNFADEYAAARDEGISYYPPLLDQRTATGLLANYFPVGPALISSPVYLAVLALRPSGEPEYGPPFSVAISLVSLLMGLLTLVLSYRLAASISGREAAIVAVAAGAAATSFIYYLLYEPSYSHMFSACAVAAFLYLWYRGRDRRTAGGWVALGVLGGIMGLIRYQDGPLLLIALLDRPRRWWHLPLFFAAVVVAFSPQLFVDRVVFGGWLPARPPGQDLVFFPGHYLDVLFSTHYGLFSWTPIALLAVVGFSLVPDRRLQLAFVYAFLVETIIGGATPDWAGGFAFGSRRFVSLMPFFAIGLAALAQRIPNRVRWIGVAILVAWNLVLIANLTFVHPSGDPGWRGLLTGQVHAIRFLPHLISQGAVGRALLFWPVLHLSFDPLYGLAVLLGLVACLAVALLALRQLPDPRWTTA
jgi:hypothetical protein